MNRLQYLVLIVFAVSLSAFRFSADPKPAKINRVAGKAITYKVDEQNSKLTWLAKKVTGEHSGNVKVTGGSLVLDKNVLKGGSFDIDTRTISVTDITDPETNGKLLGHLKSDDFFAVEKFPAAKFVITSVTPTGAGKYDVKGKLTIKGITNDVAFPATVKVDGNKVQADAKITIDRTKYGIKFRSKNFFENLGDKTIYDDFDLNVTLAANKQ
ncbi:YceI family protein [Pedobacter hiemivivus]|uniref:YceI family protein n=1 Tax=Pedobacter hiemivivus TaxID=2530454 RepID=A0A4R0N6T5_9SPHI|nr:YceI family protein [Pedobacter hiemivivus]TCC95781.1 YceI family protein [Pedobacter hiemivivus]